MVFLSILHSNIFPITSDEKIIEFKEIPNTHVVVPAAGSNMPPVFILHFLEIPVTHKSSFSKFAPWIQT